MNRFDLAAVRTRVAGVVRRLRAVPNGVPHAAVPEGTRSIAPGLAVLKAGSAASLLSTRLGAFGSLRGNPPFRREPKASRRIEIPPTRILLPVSGAIPRPAAFGRSVRAGHRGARRPPHRPGAGRRSGVLRLSVPDGPSVAPREGISWLWRTGGASVRAGASCAGCGAGSLGCARCRRCAAGKAEALVAGFRSRGDRRCRDGRRADRSAARSVRRGPCGLSVVERAERVPPAEALR